MQLHRTATRFTFLAIALAAVVAIVAVSLDRNAYFYHWDEDRPKWTYPFSGVLMIIGFTLAETALVYGVLTGRRPRLFWMRAVLGIVVLGTWGTILLLPIVHSPGFYMLHLLYVWLLVTAVALGLAATLVHQGIGWLRVRRTDNR
jgi:peptidoglycan/LPS O-acetylase OafA/YrhL